MKNFSSSSCRFVFFLDPCNIDLVKRKIRSVALCVSACPEAQLQTYDDLRKFSETNGETLISFYGFNNDSTDQVFNHVITSR